MTIGQNENTPLDEVSEDDRGLFVDPEASGPHSFEQPLPPLEPIPPIEEEVPEEPRRNPLKRRILSVVGIVLAVSIVSCGLAGLLLFMSVQRMEASVDSLQVQASLLKDAFLDGDGASHIKDGG